MHNFKNKRAKPLAPQLIVDNFFEMPQTLRDWTMAQEFFKGERGSWPGIRTKLLDELNTELVDLLKSKLLALYPQFDDFSDIDCSLQVIGEEWGQGWVHDDNSVHVLAGIVFLTPYPKPDSGNTTYMQQDDVSTDIYDDAFVSDMKLDADHKAFEKYRLEQRSKFTPSVVVENRFNRLIAFDPRMWHSANNFFGTTKENGRLTLVFFCNE